MTATVPLSDYCKMAVKIIKMAPNSNGRLASVLEFRADLRGANSIHETLVDMTLGIMVNRGLLETNGGIPSYRLTAAGEECKSFDYSQIAAHELICHAIDSGKNKIALADLPADMTDDSNLLQMAVEALNNCNAVKSHKSIGKWDFFIMQPSADLVKGSPSKIGGGKHFSQVVNNDYSNTTTISHSSQVAVAQGSAGATVFQEVQNANGGISEEELSACIRIVRGEIDKLNESQKEEAREELDYLIEQCNSDKRDSQHGLEKSYRKLGRILSATANVGQILSTIATYLNISGVIP